MSWATGRVAQSGERRPYKPEVTGSIPVPPTNPIKIPGILFSVFPIIGVDGDVHCFGNPPVFRPSNSFEWVADSPQTLSREFIF
jgi:hypothetical protein